MKRFALLSVAFLMLWGYGCLEGSGSDDNGDACSNQDCGGHGQCVDQDGAVVCVCEAGYSPDGLDCVADECTADFCFNGECVMQDGVPACNCDEGYAGTKCDVCASGYHIENMQCVVGSPCTDDPCIYGICTEDGGEALCVCHNGYAGTLCDTCAEGYIEDNLQCVLDNDCHPNPCGIGGACLISEGAPVCICNTGYTGELCDTCSDNYKSDGLACIPEDTIIDPTNPCQPNPCTEENRSVCITLEDSYACECDEGYYEDDDGACIPTGEDPCIPNPCTQPNMTECLVNEDGETHTCKCAVGFVGEKCDVRNGELKVTYYDSTRTIENLYIAGGFNDWELTDKMENEGNGNFSIILDLDPGDYSYKFVDSDADNWFLDPENPYTIYENNIRNSRLRVDDPRNPLLQLFDQPEVTDDAISFRVGFIRGTDENEINASSIKVKRNGVDYTVDFDSENKIWTVNDTGLENGKYSYLFEAADSEGHKARNLFVPVWIEDQTFDWRDGAMYFTLTDRFRDGDQSNNSPVSGVDTRANWQGGDFEGLLQTLEDDYFDDLGINVLWVSSVSQNTKYSGAGVSDGRQYSGYHSYWPISTGWTEENPLDGVEPVDQHFGDLELFKQVVQEAHSRGIRVIVDFVVNHVHSDHPWWDEHKNDGWFYSPNSPYICGWDQPITCWFTAYLPDLNYTKLDLMNAMTDHAIWLVQETNIDGFRMDAVKHIIHDLGWTLRARLSEEIDTNKDVRFYMVGETFVGENEAGTIKEYISEMELDGQFDFPVYWNTKNTFLNWNRDFNETASRLLSNENFYSDFAILSNFMGNHDVTRAVSEAAGNTGSAWDNPPTTPTNEEPYKRLRLAWSFLYTIHGIPLIYYGDEFGMPGSGDPDNRRMMIFGNSLNTQQKATLAHVKKLGKIRNDNIALRRGERIQITNDANFWAYGFNYEGNKILVVLNRSDSTVSRSVNVSALGVTSGSFTEQLRGGSAAVSGGSVNVSVPAKDASIYKLD